MSAAQQTFNPCSLEKNEQIPAKIWELLRRNETFRVAVQRLRELDAQESKHYAKTGRCHCSAWHRSCKLVERVDELHPFAGMALQWLVPEPHFIVQHVAWPLGRKWKKRRAFSPRVLAVGEGTTPDTEDREHWRWWKKASQTNHVGRLNTRGPQVHWTTSKSKRLCDKVNPLLEWRRFDWPFTVDHPWDKAPHEFRRQFQFIWRSRFDARPVNPISNSRSDSPRVHQSDFFQGWHLEAFQASGNLSRADIVKVIKFKDLADSYCVFAVPKTILTKESATATGRWVAAELKKGSDFYGKLLQGKLLNEGELLGTEPEWRDLLTGNTQGLSAIEKDSHFYRRRKYLTGLAVQIYPKFNLENLLAPSKHRARGKKYIPKGRQS